MHVWIWLAVAGICAAIEILSFNLVFASFSLAALVAGLAQYFSGSMAVPLISFAAISVLSLKFFKPVVLKFLFRKTPPSDTGMLALVGVKAVATSEIGDSTGTITLRGETWTARYPSGVINVGSEVTVTEIAGAIAMVMPVFSENQSKE
jgi:membrane protein implicated in regulation of membrane protease activity